MRYALIGLTALLLSGSVRAEDFQLGSSLQGQGGSMHRPVPETESSERLPDLLQARVRVQSALAAARARQRPISISAFSSRNDSDLP